MVFVEHQEGIGWPVNLFPDWERVYYQIDWLIDWLIDCSIVRLIDWLICVYFEFLLTLSWFAKLFSCPLVTLKTFDLPLDLDNSHQSLPPESLSTGSVASSDSLTTKVITVALKDVFLLRFLVRPDGFKTVWTRGGAVDVWMTEGTRISPWNRMVFSLSAVWRVSRTSKEFPPDRPLRNEPRHRPSSPSSLTNQDG